ncbi:uncharacterized protein PHACADRAFT_211217 [Phanerochaete carnosa HHB-10118-sp]|uniref:Uncharacterized protein n=1 Tax=Phanerochaete carnosa (strain HHB-10118-sp) TaxID=650164 RepID=K5VPY2_PHACS|nr:uncharacterized protein PHACADRAFT_211217 [Phanerochaete carnosa HHB-10118-sp]EKM53528.1 hypothetical protein PHACADRAFT_211217 [Phanerochaete carnosa HHB-10118-sp]
MASGHTSVHKTLADARKTLVTAGATKKTKLEKGLDGVGNAFDKVSNPSIELVTGGLPDVAKETWQALQPTLQAWERRYNLLEKTLDMISDLHPAIKSAVVAFKAAIQFEITRRQNDRKVDILRVAMMETMNELTCLETCLPRKHDTDRATAHDLIHQHLKKIIEKITDAIKQYVTECDSFQNRHVVVRAAKSLGWAQKLQDFSGIVEDELADELIKDFAVTEAPAATPSKDQETRAAFKAEIKRDLKSSLDSILMQLNGASLAKFKGIVQRDGDRVISRILGGPQDNIKDPGVWKVWSEMGWKRCAESRPLVKVLREYYAEIYESLQAGDEDAALVLVTSGVRPRSASAGTTVRQADRKLLPGKKARVFSLEDGWTLRYINMLRLNPLLEMLDRDFSSWVTVKEINTFTGDRPEKWSVPHWMTYWTIGQALSTAYYYVQVRQILRSILQSQNSVLPCNHALVDIFINRLTYPDNGLHRILAGAYALACEVTGEYTQFDKLEDYVFEKEQQLRYFLEKIGYYLDAPNTVALLLGSDRLEQVRIVPSYLSRQIVELACKVPLHEHELHYMANSCTQLTQAAVDRIDTIKKDICLVNDLPEKDTLKKFASGLYFYLAYYSEWELCDYCQKYNPEHEYPPIISGYSNGTKADAADAATPSGKIILRYAKEPVEVVNLQCYEVPAVTTQDAAKLFMQPADILTSNIAHSLLPLFRPPEHFSGVREPQALWRFARNAVMHIVKTAAKRIRWEHFQARRDLRRRYIELYSRLMDSYWVKERDYTLLTILSIYEEEELRDLELALNKADVCFYKSLAYFLRRSSMVHRASCDYCGKFPIRRSRVICIDCCKWAFAQKNVDDSVDLCIGCTGLEFRDETHGQQHRRSHRLLQFRRYVQKRWMKSFMTLELEGIVEMNSESGEEDSDDKGDIEDSGNEFAERYVGAGAPSMTSDISSEDGGNDASAGKRTKRKVCARCKRVVQKPYWYCFDCWGGIYVCEDCNLQDDKDRDTLTTGWQDGPKAQQKRRVGGASHEWNHTMIFWQKSPGAVSVGNDDASEDPGGSKPSLKDKLRVVEERTQRAEDLLSEMRTMLATISNHFQLAIPSEMKAPDREAGEVERDTAEGALDS